MKRKAVHTSKVPTFLTKVFLIEPDKEMALYLTDLLAHHGRKAGFEILIYGGSSAEDMFLDMKTITPQLICLHTDIALRKDEPAMKYAGLGAVERLREQGYVTPVIVRSPYEEQIIMQSLKAPLPPANVFSTTFVIPWVERAVRILTPPTNRRYYE